jgi:TonB-dependent SusC/RagA subfamily outer membrane receptor
LCAETQNGVQTDFDGKYTITVNTGDVLEFSFLGFKNQTVTVGAQSSYNVSLEIAATEIDAAVIDVYRSTTVRKSPAAISTLSIEAIEDRANASVLQNLQGQVAGLNIATGSGQPGADSTIILRGVGTINGNVEPLFVVDGVPVDEDGFRTVNQNDIATVRVLKDAAATSIYGNRGANGVVVITTKRGSFDQPLEFRYSSQFGFSELQPLNIDLMNSRERLQYERMYGVGAGAGLTDAQIDVLANQTNTYWTDIFFRTGVTKSHDLAITSGFC